MLAFVEGSKLPKESTILIRITLPVDERDALFREEVAVIPGTPSAHGLFYLLLKINNSLSMWRYTRFGKREALDTFLPTPEYVPVHALLQHAVDFHHAYRVEFLLTVTVMGHGSPLIRKLATSQNCLLITTSRYQAASAVVV